MELGSWILVAVIVLALIVATDLAQLWWVAQRANPDHGPRSREQWERTTADRLEPGDVVLASVLSPGPETVVEIHVSDAGELVLRFRSGRSRTTPGTTVVRRHRPTDELPPG